MKKGTNLKAKLWLLFMAILGFAYSVAFGYIWYAHPLLVTVMLSPVLVAWFFLKNEIEKWSLE